MAELLIALAILGVIATFTIPKILTAQQSSTSNANAHEVMSMLAAAYQIYQQNNAPVASSTTVGALTQYMNYVSVPTSGSLDDVVGANNTFTCNSGGNSCLQLHNGGTLVYPSGVSFGGTNTTNVIYMLFDPDSVRGTSGTADGPSKSISIIIYYSGRIGTYGTITSGSASSGGTYTPGNRDPSWFQL